MASTTKELGLNLLSGLEKLHKDVFNDILEDIDTKCLGVSHISENSHWALWKKNTQYVKGDIVRTSTCKSNQYLQCIVGGISGEDEPTNRGTGAQVSDNTAIWIIYDIGGTGGGGGGVSVFVGGQYYTRGQIIISNGILYRSIKDHVAEQTLKDDLHNLQKLYSNIRQWADSTSYFNDDIVINNNKLYKCNKDHISADTFVSDISSWDLLGSDGVKEFKPSTYYVEGSIIVEGNRLYRCILAHTSTTDLLSDIKNWELLSNVQDWEAKKTYIQGNIVLYNNMLYKVKNSHTSNNFSSDRDKFELMYSNIADFDDSISYKAGSYVLYNNNIYKA